MLKKTRKRTKAYTVSKIMYNYSITVKIKFFEQCNAMQCGMQHRKT